MGNGHGERARDVAQRAQRGASLPLLPAPGRAGSSPRGGSGLAGADRGGHGLRELIKGTAAAAPRSPALGSARTRTRSRTAAHGAARPARHGPLRGGAPPHRECLQGESATGARRRVSPFSCSRSYFHSWISPPRDARGQSGRGARPGPLLGCARSWGWGRHGERGTPEARPAPPRLARHPRDARSRRGQRCPRITPERGSPALPQSRAFPIPWSSGISPVFLSALLPVS